MLGQIKHLKEDDVLCKYDQYTSNNDSIKHASCAGTNYLTIWSLTLKGITFAAWTLSLKVSLLPRRFLGTLFIMNDIRNVLFCVIYFLLRQMCLFVA
jgi:hypothetical protein